MFLTEYVKTQEDVKVYCADGEADSLVMSIAVTLCCPLLGEDSDFFIPELPGGYMPLSKIKWEGAGHPVTGKFYLRDEFAEHLQI